MSKKNKNTKATLGIDEVPAALVAEGRAHGATLEKSRVADKKWKKRFSDLVKLMNSEINLRQEQILLGKRELAKADDLIERYLGIILSLGLQIGSMESVIQSGFLHQKRLQQMISEYEEENEQLLSDGEVLNRQVLQQRAIIKELRKAEKPKKKKKKKKKNTEKEAGRRRDDKGRFVKS